MPVFVCVFSRPHTIGLEGSLKRKMVERNSKSVLPPKFDGRQFTLTFRLNVVHLSKYVILRNETPFISLATYTLS